MPSLGKREECPTPSGLPGLDHIAAVVMQAHGNTGALDPLMSGGAIH